jgi:hypothetical protein
MKTTMYVCAWISAVLCLCGCEEDRPSATVAVQVVPEAYAAPYAMPVFCEMEYTLEVVVQSNSGLPLAGAWVQVVADDFYGNDIQQANTDEWGRAYFYFCVQPGSWVFIDAGSSGFASSAVDLATGDDPYPAVPIYLAPIVVAM